MLTETLVPVSSLVGVNHSFSGPAVHPSAILRGRNIPEALNLVLSQCNPASSHLLSLGVKIRWSLSLFSCFSL